MATPIVSGAMYENIATLLFEIGRQLRQTNGYPFDPAALKAHLQDALKGRFAATQLLRETGELAVEIPALRRPTLQQIRKRYPWIGSIERDDSPEGPVTLKLATFLLDEERIDGSEFERRLVLHPDVLLGLQHVDWFLKRQREYPAFMKLLRNIYVEFPGIVLVDDTGNRSVPCCCKRGAHWIRRWELLENGLGVHGRLAVAANR